MKTWFFIGCLLSLTNVASATYKMKSQDSSLFNFSLKHKIHQPGPGSRPCCAFGTNIRLLFFPFIRLDQVVGSKDLNTHSFGGKGSGPKEKQGEVFTCQAGFIDSSHARHAADWTAYFAALIEKNQSTGGTFKLKWEGGKRWFTIPAFKTPLSKENIITIAQRVAYDTTVWHEIMTWYVPAVIPFFSEKSSSFAPEDNFSNLLGTYLAREALLSKKPYNLAMGEAFAKVLQKYEGKSKVLTQKAFKLVASKWWDEKKYLPNQWKTLVRHTLAYGTVVPLIPEERKELECKSEEVATLDVPQTIEIEGEVHNITDLYELDVRPHKKIPWGTPDGKHRSVSHRDYPKIVKEMENEIRDFYLLHDRPDPIRRPKL